MELLVRLKQAQAAAPAKPQAVIPLRWGLRLPRSKAATAVSSGRCDVVCRRKDGDSSARCSPTTPLSWSGGGGAASPSATADGFEDTSPHISRSLTSARSKVSFFSSVSVFFFFRWWQACRGLIYTASLKTVIALDECWSWKDELLCLFTRHYCLVPDFFCFVTNLPFICKRIYFRHLWLFFN